MMNENPGRLAVLGVVGTVLVALVVVAALNIDRLPLISGGDVLHVQFAEAGGLEGGDAVMISGARVGEVREVRLDGDLVDAEIVITDPDIEIGDRTEARIITMTLLGQAAVELEPRGSGETESGQTIPVGRTSSPYNLTSTLNQLSSTSAAIDKAQLATALEEVSATFSASSADLGPALEGITALASALSANDEELQSLVGRAARVTAELSSRDEQIASLLGAGHSLLAEVNARRDVVVGLLHSARALADQLRSTMRATDDVLEPALRQLDAIVDILNENKQNLQASITGLQGYAMAFGEAVASGPWFDAYIQNLTAPTTLLPVLSEVTQ